MGKKEFILLLMNNLKISRIGINLAQDIYCCVPITQNKGGDVKEVHGMWTKAKIIKM